MSDTVLLDTNILADISRGSTAAADALNQLVRSGTTVYISRPAYDELVTNAPTPYLRGHYREMLADMRIQIAPPGNTAVRQGFYADNIQHAPQPGKPGQLTEYGDKAATKPGDAFVAAQAKALNAKLWTHDEKMAKRAAQLGVTLAPQCSIGGTSGPEDPVRGRQLLGLNPKTIGGNGQVIPPPPSGGGGGGRGGTTATIGVADNTVPEFVGPSQRGQAIVGGIQLAFEGANIILNLVNDSIQKKKANEALDAIRPAVSQARAANPQMGVLLLFYYLQVQASQESIIKPGAVFDYVIWGKGTTRDEAMQDALRTPTLSRGPGRSEVKFSQESWIPPLKPSALTLAKPPFKPIAQGRFFLGNSNKARFQLVEFNVVGGFDDVVETSLELPDGKNADFVILETPAQVHWYNINGKQSVDVPRKLSKTSNDNELNVVDLDAWSPFHAKAAMIFPIDEWTEKVFSHIEPTRGLQALGAYANFRMVRWVRPENIHLLRFM